MSTRSGKKTSRNRMATYKGFDIIQVVVIKYYKPSYSDYYTNIVDKKEVHYDFCKEGEYNKPSKAYECWASNVAECKECIDNFIKDDTIYFTAEEREKYVYRPNRKCDWAYDYDSLMKILKEHQKATKRMKILIEDRLTDANFHSESGLLAQGDYEGYKELVERDYQFQEKFEIITSSMCKRIRNPKQFELGLKNVIQNYLISQGVEKTSVKVKFIENW